MYIKITAKDKENNELFSNFEFDLYEGNLSGSGNINISDTIENIIDLIYSHDIENITNGIPPVNRDYLKKLSTIPYDNSILSNLYRSLAVITRFQHIDFLLSLLKNSNVIVNNPNLQLYNPKETFYDFICFEKTGNLGVQPSIYLIKESLVSNNYDDLLYLYDKGLLYKVEINTKINLISFFIPFSLPKINRLSLGPKFFFWNNILEDREKCIDSFTKR